MAEARTGWAGAAATGAGALSVVVAQAASSSTAVRVDRWRMVDPRSGRTMTVRGDFSSVAAGSVQSISLRVR